MVHLHVVSAKVWGGGEQYVYNLCKESQRQGVACIVVVDKNQTYIAERFAEVAKVYRAPLRGGMGIRACFAVKKLIKDCHVDVLNCHSGSMVLLCVLLRKSMADLRLLVYRHNVTPNKKDSYHKWVQKNVDAFVCVSKMVYNLQIATADKQYIDKFHLIYSGIDTNAFSNETTKKQTGEFIVGYAGRLIENKGVLQLIEAVKELHDENKSVKLLLCGPVDVSFETNFANLKKTYDQAEWFEYLGIIDDMNSFYSKIDVFVLPSIVKEAFGLVLCEAMYCGVLVITTDSGAQTEIIENDINGYLVECGSANAIKEKLDLVFSNKQKRETIAAAGRKTVEKKFTLARCVKDIIELSDGLLEQN